MMKLRLRAQLFWLGIAVLPIVFGLSAANAAAESLVAARAIIGGSVIEEVDLRRSKKLYPGALSDPLDAIGLEARVTIHAGRPIHVNSVQAPALVERNDRVQISFTSKTLSITTEGRALDRGGVGDRVRVMNLSSRSTVSGLVTADGRIEVSRP